MQSVSTTVQRTANPRPASEDDWQIRVRHPKTIDRSASGIRRRLADLRPASEDDWQICVRHPKTIGRSAINRGFTVIDFLFRFVLVSGTQKARAPRHPGTPSILVIYFFKRIGKKYFYIRSSIFDILRFFKYRISNVEVKYLPEKRRTSNRGSKTSSLISGQSWVDAALTPGVKDSSFKSE